MKSISEEKIIQLREELKRYSLEEYFERMQEILNSVNGLEDLTQLFTVEPYTEDKPYLIIRTLTPVDNRFKDITIVYNFDNQVCAVEWGFETSLDELVSWFGPPIIRNVLHTNTTTFAFKTKGPALTAISTHYLDWLTEVENSVEGLSYTNEQGIRLSSSEIRFSFLQFSLKVSGE